MRKPVLIFRDAFGLFWHDRYKAMVEAVFNLLISILLANYFGIFGVLLGTTISTIFVCLWVEPCVLKLAIYFLQASLREHCNIYFLIMVLNSFMNLARIIIGTTKWQAGVSVLCPFMDLV